jgi:hypothetical protein
MILACRLPGLPEAGREAAGLDTSTNNMQGVGGGTAVPGSHWVMASHQGGEGMLGAVGDLVA